MKAAMAAIAADFAGYDDGFEEEDFVDGGEEELNAADDAVAMDLINKVKSNMSGGSECGHGRGDAESRGEAGADRRQVRAAEGRRGRLQEHGGDAEEPAAEKEQLARDLSLDAGVCNERPLCPEWQNSEDRVVELPRGQPGVAAVQKGQVSKTAFHKRIAAKYYDGGLMRQLAVESELESGDARGEGACGVHVERAFARLDD